MSASTASRERPRMPGTSSLAALGRLRQVHPLRLLRDAALLPRPPQALPLSVLLGPRRTLMSEREFNVTATTTITATFLVYAEDEDDAREQVADALPIGGFDFGVNVDAMEADDSG